MARSKIDQSATYTSLLSLKVRFLEVPYKRLDRFPVNVMSAFYVPDESEVKRAGTHAFAYLPEQKPHDALARFMANWKDSAKFRHLSIVGPTYSDSKYNGLREMYATEDNPEYELQMIKQAEKYGGAYPDGSKRYIEKLGSPYELLMDCDAPNSLWCTANVYFPSDHFQYKIRFSAAAVSHADETFRAVNALIQNWIQH